MKRFFYLLFGIVAMLLGGLWLAQGLDIVHVGTILCFADCEIISGGSRTWSAIGFCLIIVGALTIFFKACKRKTQ